MVIYLLYLKTAIKLYDQLYGITTLLSATDWAVLRVLKPVMDPFMRAQASEGRKVRGGQPCAPYLRPPRGVEQGVSRLRGIFTGRQGVKVVVRSAIAPCVCGGVDRIFQ